ncbi:hypothetical protein O7626_05830 [Micromonospora sp. WMMD1102]|uniref:hypothetical protein n=1 Tax=Micromonospora sp. WMMD1102 TaxID=3016105 RepID=UPI002414F6D2|nr:hypothetical protein [Micromonospora sp. WMMD1102]MDG4785456.1 hypothetical protein [Micromonospora sp. WMMD1102]
MRRATATVLLTATSMVLAACMGEGNDVQPTETQATAVERVEKLIQDAKAQLPAGTTLDDEYRSNEAACDDPTDNGPAGRIFVEHRYSIVSSDNHGRWKSDLVIPPLVAYWQQQGFRVRHDLRDQPDPRYTVENSDGYRATIEGFDRGSSYDFYLTVGSPCIWQNGTPNPQ